MDRSSNTYPQLACLTNQCCQWNAEITGSENGCVICQLPWDTLCHFYWTHDFLAAGQTHAQVEANQYFQLLVLTLLWYSDVCTLYKCICFFNNTNISGVTSLLKYSRGLWRLSGGVTLGPLNEHSVSSKGFFLQETFLGQFFVQIRVYVLGRLYVCCCPGFMFGCGTHRHHFIHYCLNHHTRLTHHSPYLCCWECN